MPQIQVNPGFCDIGLLPCCQLGQECPRLMLSLHSPYTMDVHAPYSQHMLAYAFASNPHFTSCLILFLC
uniref:Uncharacterized protein n=1 Tax=Arundo donax TaxID=35708 RepID=A0A0A9HMX0_ARUDO